MNSFCSKEKILAVPIILLVLTIIGPFMYTARAQALLQVGTDATDFSLKDIKGGNITLSQFTDKKAVVLVFWSTWSARSSKALKRFEDYHKKYADKDIQVISINADKQLISGEDLESIKKFVQELDITFPVLIDNRLKTFHSYSIIALPSILIISGNKISYELAGLPLVGTEDMFDYLLVLAGEEPRKKMEPKYMPLHDAIANTNLARQFVKKGINMMAIPLFRKAIDKDPKYMLPYVELAKLYSMEDKYPEAEEALRNALSVEPENVVILSELGHLLSRAGKTKESIVILKKAVKRNSYTPSYYYYAHALAIAGQLKESFNAFDKAVSLNPYEPQIYLMRARVYEDNKMLKEAAADYRKSLELRLNIQ